MNTEELKQRIALPLDEKIKLSQQRIHEWYEAWDGAISVSFSGGLDSTVLLTLTRLLYPNISGVFVDTGLEYPEIRAFVRKVDNIIWLKPKLSFNKIIEKYGYPVISKEQSCAISRYKNTKSLVQKYRRLHGWPKGKKGMISKKWQFMINAPFKISDACCDHLKKNPMDKYCKENNKYPMLGMTVFESRGRKLQYLRQGGCNAFDNKKPKSWPIAFWTKEDIGNYIKKYNLSYSSIYNTEKRTGCMFCMFGVHLETGSNRFQRIKQTHPKHWDYCINKLGCGKVLDYIGVDY